MVTGPGHTLRRKASETAQHAVFLCIPAGLRLCLGLSLAQASSAWAREAGRKCQGSLNWQLVGPTACSQHLLAQEHKCLALHPLTQPGHPCHTFCSVMTISDPKGGIWGYWGPLRGSRTILNARGEPGVPMTCYNQDLGLPQSGCTLLC